MDSILTSIKNLLGMESDYTHFDSDIIIHINTVFATLTQLGVGPKEGFAISDVTTTWDEYIPDSPTLNSVKTYVYLKVKLVFDPPTNSSTVTALSDLAKELEWRLNVASESGKTITSEEE